MADLHENYLDWLRDAHVMEEQAESMLKGMAGRLEHYPALEARIRQHIEETIEQQRLVESVIKRYDSSSSVFKDMAGKMAAMGQAVGDTEGQRIFTQILEQEKAMAAWLLEHLPETTRQFLARSQAPHTEAKKIGR